MLGERDGVSGGATPRVLRAFVRVIGSGKAVATTKNNSRGWHRIECTHTPRARRWSSARFDQVAAVVMAASARISRLDISSD